MSLLKLRAYSSPWVWLIVGTSAGAFSCGQQNPSFTEGSTGTAQHASEDLGAGQTDGGQGTSGQDAVGQEGGGPSTVGIEYGTCPSCVDGEGGAGAGTGGGTGGVDDGSGTGGGATGGEEGFPDLRLVVFDTTQVRRENVDILWVVDSSGSMAEEQSFLASSFSSFMTAMAAQNFDFQTAVTSTDVCQGFVPSDLSQVLCPRVAQSSSTQLRGDFRGPSGKKVLAKADYQDNLAALVSQFQSNVNVGTQGSSFEHGLTAAKMAVEKTLNGQSPALIRPDSFLPIIVVSDEEDDGIGLSKADGYSPYTNWFATGETTYKFTEDNMISFLNANVGAGNYSISAITGTRDANGTMCSSANSSPLEEGTQYLKAAQKTGGLALSICATNWQSLLTQIGQDIATQSTQIPLPEQPYAHKPIEVYVDGVLNSQWSYVSGSNAIMFEASSAPPNNAAISIKFYVVE